MKILHVAAGLENVTGGPAEVIPRMALALAQRGHGVTVVYTADSASGRNPLLGATDCVREIVFPRHGRVKWSPPLRKGIERLIEDCDLLHVHGLWEYAPYIARRAALASGKPFVCSPHGALSLWGLARRKLFKRGALFFWERRLLEATEAFLVTGEHEARDLWKELPGARAFVVPHGIAAPSEDQALGPREGGEAIGERTPVVGFLGRLHPVKALAELVSAISMLRSEIPGLRLCLAGPVSAGERAWAEALVESAEPGAISWVGPLDEKRKWDFLRQCDVVALPSYFENFGMAAGEALAVGCPVVVGRETAWSEVEAAGFGAVVAPTADSIAAGIRRVLVDPDLRARTRAAGPQWIRDNFSWAAVAQKIEAVYEVTKLGKVYDSGFEG